MGEVIELGRSTGYDGSTCDCGSAWFDAVVCLNNEGGVAGYSMPLRCHECGRSVSQ